MNCPVSRDAERWPLVTRFEVLPQFSPRRGTRFGGIAVEKRRPPDGVVYWVVTAEGSRLGQDGEWHWMPLPSNRSEELMAWTRFDTLDAAWDAAERAADRELAEAGVGLEGWTIGEGRWDREREGDGDA